MGNPPPPASSRRAPVPRRQRHALGLRAQREESDRRALQRAERHGLIDGYVRAGLLVVGILSLGIPSALAGHSEAWFGVGLVLAIVGFFVVRWTKFPMPIWLGVGLIAALMGASIWLACR